MKAAQMAGVSHDVMKQEISRAYKRRLAMEKKAQEKKDLEIAAAHQPHSRELRYNNMKSAIAEETILRMLLRENALFDKVGELKGQDFSVPMFEKAFEALKNAYELEHNAGVHLLGEVLSSEEMAHMTSVIHKQDHPISEEAFFDCMRVVLNEARKANGADDLRAFQEQLRKKKGYGGT